MAFAGLKSTPAFWIDRRKMCGIHVKKPPAPLWATQDFPRCGESAKCEQVPLTSIGTVQRVIRGREKHATNHTCGGVRLRLPLIPQVQVRKSRRKRHQ